MISRLRRWCASAHVCKGLALLVKFHQEIIGILLAISTFATELYDRKVVLYSDNKGLTLCVHVVAVWPLPNAYRCGAHHSAWFSQGLRPQSNSARGVDAGVPTPCARVGGARGLRVQHQRLSIEGRVPDHARYQGSLAPTSVGLSADCTPLACAHCVCLRALAFASGWTPASVAALHAPQHVTT